jgi:hypothetical protein
MSPKTDYASEYISDTISVYYSTYWRGPYITATDDIVDPMRTRQPQIPTTTNGDLVQTIVIDDEPVASADQTGNNVIIDSNAEQMNDNDDHMIIDGYNDDDHGDMQHDIQLNLDNYLLLNNDDEEDDRSISE